MSNEIIPTNKSLQKPTKADLITHLLQSGELVFEIGYQRDPVSGKLKIHEVSIVTDKPLLTVSEV